MLVDVIELYWHDSKLSRETRRQATPVRGHIDVDRMWTHAALEKSLPHAHLRPYRLEPLYNARMHYWRGRNVVLSGSQRQPISGKQREATFEQWWWIQIVLDPSVPPIPLCKRPQRNIWRAAAAPAIA